MKTKRQEELVDSYLLDLGDEIRPLYQDIIMYLSKLGYNPHKQRSNIIFKHSSHNKQMAKMGLKRDKSPFFALRFSACRGYSQRFEDIVRAAMAKKSFREAQCINDCCSYCAGEAATHVYTYTSPDGATKYHCGAALLEIPDISQNDIQEIKRLIQEEHAYLMFHQAGVSE